MEGKTVKTCTQCKNKQKIKPTTATTKHGCRAVDLLLNFYHFEDFNKCGQIVGPSFLCGCIEKVILPRIWSSYSSVKVEENKQSHLRGNVGKHSILWELEEEKIVVDMMRIE